MNKKKLIISSIIIIWGMIPFISFGQDQIEEPCLTCGSSPANLNLLNSFTKEIISNIRTIGTKGLYAGKHVPPSRFDSGEFIPQKKGFIAKSLRRAQESIGSILGVARIFGNFGTLINPADSLAVLGQNRAILRDRQKLGLVEKDINRKKYELSVGNGRSDIIKHKNKENIEAVFKKYKDLGIIDSYTLGDGAKFGELITILQKINNNIKHLIGLNGNLGGVDLSSRQFGGDDIFLILNEKKIKQILEDYQCTRLYACEQSRANYIDELKNIRESTKDGRNGAWKEFDRANKELSDTRDSTKKSFKKRREKMKEKYNKAKEKTKNLLDSVKNRRPVGIEAMVEYNNQIKKNISTENLSTKQIKQLEISNELYDMEKSIKDEANEMLSKYQNTNTSDITAYFVEISDKINHIRKKTIGNKNQNNCLIKNLGSLCEKQCSNINKTCY